MKNSRMSADQLQARLRFIIGVVLALTLMGTMFAVIYSLIFVSQPISSQAPNDQAFFQLISPIATFLTGCLSGVMIGSMDKTKHDSETEN